MIEKYNFQRDVQEFIVGEPLTICPREWEEKYPAAHYDFPPSRLGEKGKCIFIRRLRKFFEKYGKEYKHFIVFAPNHHKRIIISASEGVLEDIIIVPYNLYTLPKLYQTLREVLHR